jgi:hypothetical protein
MQIDEGVERRGLDLVDRLGNLIALFEYLMGAHRDQVFAPIEKPSAKLEIEECAGIEWRACVSGALR